MWELDNKEGWAWKNWCSQTVVLEKTLESPLDSKEIQPVNPKGNQSWIFTGRTDAEVEVPILWAPNVKRLLTGKDPDAGKGWGQEEKGMTEDEMVGWHHWLNGHEFDQTPGNSEGQGSLACCSPWGWQLNNNYLYWFSDSSPLIYFLPVKICWTLLKNFLFHLLYFSTPEFQFFFKKAIFIGLLISFICWDIVIISFFTSLTCFSLVIWTFLLQKIFIYLFIFGCIRS